MKIAFAICFAMVAFLEGVVRTVGLVDVPIRELSNTVGYMPIQSQRGSILNKKWHVNSMGMVSSKEFSEDKKSILIVGDSVVFGGFWLGQDERVGERLDRLLSKDVFSVAETGWGLKNGLNYIEANMSDFRNVEMIVFVANGGDFGSPSLWRCESMHPTAKPIFHLYVFLRKILYKRCIGTAPDSFLVDDFDLTEKILRLKEVLGDTEFRIFLFQNKREFSLEFSLYDMVDAEVRTAIGVSELLEYRAYWRDRYYYDHIHPNSDGALVLAQILRMIIVECVGNASVCNH